LLDQETAAPATLLNQLKVIRMKKRNREAAMLSRSSLLRGGDRDPNLEQRADKSPKIRQHLHRLQPVADCCPMLIS
jgi:hypothetical protein